MHKTFLLRGIVAMTGAAVDRALVPRFDGVTDAETMGQWDPPFEIDLKKIRSKDEAYWKKYRTAPKAFVSLSAARALWLGDETAEEDGTGSKGGWVTSIRLAPTQGGDLALSAQKFERALVRRFPPEKAGLAFRPVKDELLAAAEGSTDFAGLFLAMSMFLVASAVCLVALLVRLTIERRAKQFGIMLASGFTPVDASRTLSGEGAVLSVVGVVAGIGAGVGYACAIIHALRTKWAGAVGEFPLEFHLEARSLLIGAAGGLVVSIIAVLWAIRLLLRSSALTLLAGWRSLAPAGGERSTRRSDLAGGLLLAVAACLLVLAAVFHVVSTTTAFFAAGAAMLLGVLALAAGRLHPRATEHRGRRLSLAKLAWRSASRHRLRSLLTTALMACASFMIVAVAANRKDLTRLATNLRTSGAGGFNLSASSDVPIFSDLNTPRGREELGFREDERKWLRSAVVYPFRLKAGDDVSCLNLQRPSTPRVLGVPRELIERGGFSFAKIAPGFASTEARSNPWVLLDAELSGGSAGANGVVVPAFADADSAQWILHKKLGDEIEVADGRGGVVRLRLVGLLSQSIFAGELLISEKHFVRCFGSDGGYRYFLIKTPAEAERAVADALRRNLGELGFDVRRTADILAGFARVQNTYLSTFQTLGGLGLVLGTFGIVVVLLRAAVERRSEFAMMTALGFRRLDIFVIITMENGLLLVSGIAIGSVCALVAVAPHLLSNLSDVDWLSLAGTLFACALVGLASCAVAAGASVQRRLLPALRSE